MTTSQRCLAVAKEPTPEAQVAVIKKIVEHGSVVAAVREASADKQVEEGSGDRGGGLTNEIEVRDNVDNTDQMPKLHTVNDNTIAEEKEREVTLSCLISQMNRMTRDELNAIVRHARKLLGNKFAA